MSISKTLTLTSKLVALDNTLIEGIAKNQKNDSNSKLDKVILLVDWSKIEKLDDNELIGLEVMLVESGEKEFFELSDYNKEGYKRWKDDIENLHVVWDEINYSHTKEEIFDSAID